MDLDQLIVDAAQLEPLPASSLRLAKLVAEPDWEVDELTQVIRFDQALAGRLLGLANSAYCAGQQRISQIGDAILRVGPGTVLSLALSGHVRGTLQAALPEYGLAEGALWRHSVASALAAERSRIVCQRPVAREAFAAALLHDLGCLVLTRHLDSGLRSDLERARRAGQGSPLEAERSVLGVDHAELGALLARNWTLPESMCAGILQHHTPWQAAHPEHQAVADTIALADCVAQAIGAGDESGADAHRPTIAELRERCQLSQEQFDELCRDVHLHLDEVLALYS